jgi:hypothetical protein
MGDQQTPAFQLIRMRHDFLLVRTTGILASLARTVRKIPKSILIHVGTKTTGIEGLICVEDATC